jgi:putative ABC transport system permease protein
MLRIALGNVVAHRSRFAMTALAIALSVAFLIATLGLTNGVRGTASRDVDIAHRGVDAVVVGPVVAARNGGPGELAGVARASVPADAVAAARGVPGVDVAEAVTVGFAKLVVDGRAVGTGTAVDVGRSWVADEELNPFDLVAGRAPSAADEVAIDRNLAAAGDLGVGSPAQILTATGTHDVTVTGLLTYGSSDAAPLQRTVALGPEVAGRLMGLDDVDHVLVRLDPGVTDPSPTLAALTAAVAGAEVLTGEAFVAEQQEAVGAPLEILSVFLLAFALVAAAAGGTIIFATFALTMARRRRETALLRALGAHRRQVLGSILVEAVVLGLVAGAAGAVLGVLAAGVIGPIVGLAGVTIPTSTARIGIDTIAIGVVAGLLATVASAWVPARRAARLAPIDALRESAAEPRTMPRRRLLGGAACLVVAAVGGAWALAASSAAPLALLVLLVPGLALVGPALVRGAVAVLRTAAAAIGGAEGTIATQNLRANAVRSSSTLLALALCTAMVGFFAVVASSLSESITDDLADGLLADVVITSATPDYATIEPGLVDAVRAVPGVADAASVVRADASVDGSGTLTTVAGVPADFERVFDLAVTAGSLDGLAEGGVAVFDDAGGPTPAIGTEVSIRLEHGTLTGPVVAVIGRSLGGFDPPSYLVDRSVLRSVEPGLPDMFVYAVLDDADPAAEERTARAIAELVAASPGSLFETRTSYLARADAEVASIQDLVYALLGLTVLIALLGVANATALAVSERTRELGMLRAIGTTSTGVRRIVRVEAALLAGVAAVVGVTVAVGAATVLLDVAGGARLGGVTVPWVGLAVVVVLAIVGGGLAATVPAWRASRRPVLELLSS